MAAKPVTKSAAADDLRAFLRRRGVDFNERRVDYGIEFRCRDGEVITAYDKGTVRVQGTRTVLADEVNAMTPKPGLLAEILYSPDEQPVVVPKGDRHVFVVYGHDLAARDNLELVLRRMKLEPIILQNLPAQGDTVIEKLERYLGEHGNVGFACVLLTPDDEGHVAGKGEDKRYRARQNVILELGMVLARLGRSRVVILHKGSVELPSDIAGLIYRPFQERVEEARTQLFHDLREAGYEPDAAGL